LQTSTPTADVHQAAQIASRFQDLQGLRMTVGGAGLLLLFTWEMAFPLTLADIVAAGGPKPWSYVLLLAGCAVLVVGILWVNGWYRRHYGAVVRTRKQNRLGAVIGGAGALAFLIPFEAELFAMNRGLLEVPPQLNPVGHTLPANFMLFTLSLWVIAYWLYLGRRFWHYLVIGVIGFTLGLASIAGIPPATFDWHIREVTLYFGLATLAGGVIDHIILTRSMPQLVMSVAADS
jgi:hypothetical protein